MMISPETHALYLSPREAADMLGVSRPTIYRLCHRGVLPSVRVGGQVRIPRRELARSLTKPTIQEKAS